MSLPKPDLTALRRGPVRTLGVLSASVIALPLGAGSAHAGSIPVPQPSRSLPTALDVAPPYQKGTLCLTESQPGPVAFAKLLNRTYGSHTYGVLRTCDQEHGEGRALDWMLDARDPEQLALGNAVTRWLSAPDAEGRAGAMARRFGVNYVIWNRQIWKAWAPDKGWQPYSGSSPHTDHIHLSFTWDGAYQRTSWWSGVAVTEYLTGPPEGSTGSSSTSWDPADYTNVTLRVGSRGQAVKVLQKAVGGLTVDGSFGPLTETRVREYQKSAGLTVNGVVDSRVWTALAGTGASGGSGSGGSGSGGSSDASGTPSTSSAAKTLAKYSGTVLRRGSRGTAVRVLQTAVGGLTVDGAFGPRTEARVVAYQKSQGLTPNGVVDSRVWKALMAAADDAAKPGSSSGSSGSSSGSSGASSGSSGSSSGSSAGSSGSTAALAKYSGVTLRLWSRGEAVKALQKAVGGLVVDGAFGPRTLARVKDWQEEHRLVADGVVDAKDWAVLLGGQTADSAASRNGGTRPSAGTSASSATATELTRYKGTTLRAGSSGAAVRALQAAVGGLAVDGRFGPRTEARVEKVQRAAGLAPTGVVDRRTWDAVELRVHPLLPYWGTVLRRGSSGTAVKALQKALGITVDGSFGPQTEVAVKAAQRSAKVSRTGVVGVVTWKAVERQMR